MFIYIYLYIYLIIYIYIKHNIYIYIINIFLLYWCESENHSLVDPPPFQELPQIAPEFLFAMSGQLQGVQQVMEEAGSQ